MSLGGGVGLLKLRELFDHLITGRILVRRLCGSQSPTEVTHGAYESPECPLQLSVSKDTDTYLKIRKYNI